MDMLRVLIVEDQPLAAEAHAEYVGRVPGFEVAARASTGADALRLLSRMKIDLVLLDIYLPDMHGLDVVRSMRAAGHTADVIAVTVARDIDVIRAAVSRGIVHYLVKPFPFRTLQDKFEHYREYRARVSAGQPVVGQQQVDELLSSLRPGPSDLPKGMSRESLEAVVAALATTDRGLSAAQVADRIGASRVTARRYLEHLTDVGLAMRQARYGTAGRPEVEYRWRQPPRDARHDRQLLTRPADPNLLPRD